MQGECFPTPVSFLLLGAFEMRLWAGKALLMQPECRQMESDTCVCRMVFVVTLWLQIIKCSPWGDFARQAPQMKLTYSERETEETERGMKRQRRRRGGWKDREGDEAWEEHKEMKRMGRNKRKRWKKDPKTCRGRVNVFLWVRGQRYYFREWWVLEVNTLRLRVVLFSD